MSNNDQPSSEKTKQQQPSKRRQLTGWKAKATTVFAIAIGIYHILFVSHVLENAGLYIYSVQHRAISLALFLALVFILLPATKKSPRDRVPWYDVLLIIGGLLSGGYVAFAFGSIQESQFLGTAPMLGQVLCIMTWILVLESIRRAIGTPMAVIGAIFIAYVFLADYAPGFLHAKSVSLERASLSMYLTSGGIFGTPMAVASTMVIMFFTFARFLEGIGGTRFFIDMANALLGRYRGGPAKVAVAASSLMGTITGGGVVNVGITGIVTIPTMKQVGYKPEFAAAVETVASNGGQIMPPVMGIVAFLIMEFLGMPYIEVCIAALLPAILYYVAVFIMVDLEAAKSNLTGMPRADLPSLKKALKTGWVCFIPIALLIYLLAVVRMAPALAALYTTGCTLLLGYLKKDTRMGPKKILTAIETGTKSTIEAVTACAGAGIIISAVSMVGLGFRLSSGLMDLAGGSLLILLLLTALASFILGMGMTSVPCYVLLAVLVAPALVEMGILPIAAHLFVFYWGIQSFITPPVAIVSFIAAGIAGANPMGTAIQATRLAIIVFLLPFVFVYNPALLLQGGVGEIALATATSVIGAASLGVGMIGYLLHNINWIQRVCFISGAVLSIIPGTVTDIVGVAIIAMALAWHIAQHRQMRAVDQSVAEEVEVLDTSSTS